ncbi:MAG TPA: hypothetical protein VNO30_16875 [Kofleriaceae bacterium]|nr:hypothetical protein [Kofleriaceae bacterium]
MVRPAKDLDARFRQETAVRAARVAAMLDRWEAEDISAEPEWSAEDVEPMTLRHSPVDREKREP